MRLPSPRERSAASRSLLWWYLNFDRVLGRRHVVAAVVFAMPTVAYDAAIGFGPEVTLPVVIVSYLLAVLLGWAIGWL